MNSNWFDLDEDIATGFFDKSNVDELKKNFGLTSKKFEKGENWRTASEFGDILDLAAAKCEALGKSKFFDSALKDRLGERQRMSHDYASDFLSDVTRTKSRLATDRKVKNETKTDKKINRQSENWPSSASSNSYGFAEDDSATGRSRQDSIDSTWSSRKSCQGGNVSFPSSSASTLTESCGGYSEKTIGRSISRDSDDSVCTEKSVNSSTISEKLADGTDKTQIESNESWLRKSTSGSKIAEKKINDVTMTEKNDDGTCEKSATRMSYLEKSATGSSLQEEITTEKVTSSGKCGNKTIEQKTSSETFKKLRKTNSNKSSARCEDLDPRSFDPFASSSFSECKNSAYRRKEPFLPRGRSSLASEKISKLIDEAVQQDDLFRIPTSLQSDIDRMTNDFFSSKSFGRDRTGDGIHRRRLTSSLFSETDKDESYLTCSKLTKLKSENEYLQQENLKLQSIIQDVTAVNKRWQEYNNERRLYVQKLLSTIQDLQEQINLISEKSAFQSKPNEEIGSSSSHPHPHHHNHHHHHHLSEMERLRKEHREHLAVLELQIKSHKDDWEAERMEKEKAVHEKEELEKRLQDLMKDVRFLKEVTRQQERQLKKCDFCVACENDYDRSEIFQRMEFRSPSKSPNFRTAVHIPYKTAGTTSQEYYCDGGEILQEFSPSRTDSNERFSRTTAKCKNSISGDTVIVEDENGMRLAITERFPSKDTNLKSILKKGDKKNKFASRTFPSRQEEKEKEEEEEEAAAATEEEEDGAVDSKSGRNRISSVAATATSSPTAAINPSITCEEFNDSAESSVGYGPVSVGFRTGDSFAPADNGIRYLSIGSPGGAAESSRSRSEPNTRSNSSENLKPLRESSSWNSESFAADGNGSEKTVICSNCGRLFPPTSNIKFLAHFEICRPQNQF